MDIKMHMVRFDEWCSKCKYAKTNEVESPCNECLDEPVNTNSEQPVEFKLIEHD